MKWFNTILIALLAAPVYADELNLVNLRITHGELGPERTTEEFLPGDIVFFSFDIENVTVDPSGQVSYSMGMEVADPNGKKILEQKPRENNDFLPLGGASLPARAYITLSPEQSAGKYTCKITVVDNASKATKMIEKDFAVKEKSFGIVSLYSTSDSNGVVPAPTAGFEGQSLWVHFNVIGFQRGGEMKQPSVEFQMTILNEDTGKATVEKPTVYTVNEGVADDESLIRMRFPVPLNRPGKYSLMLKSTDKLADKSHTVKLPVQVVPRPY